MSDEKVVYIVDDNDEWRNSLSSLLDTVGISTITYASAYDFLDAYDPAEYGCLILDVRMPDMSGLELQRKLAVHNARLHIIFVSGHANVPTAVRAMREGARDFFEKPVDEQALLDRIQVVLRDIEVQRERDKDDALLMESLTRLTPREREVLDLLVAGSSTREIANRLGVSIRTAETYRAGILAKTGHSSMTNLLVRIKVKQSTS